MEGIIVFLSGRVLSARWKNLGWVGVVREITFAERIEKPVRKIGPPLSFIPLISRWYHKFSCVEFICRNKYTMYPWSLQANLFMGGKCTFATHIMYIASQYSVSCSVWWLSKSQLASDFSVLRNADIINSKCQLAILAGHDSDSLYILLNHVFEPSDLDLWPMTLIFGVDPGIIKIHSHAKFHEAKFIGLDFRGLNAFCVRALEKK